MSSTRPKNNILLHEEDEPGESGSLGKLFSHSAAGFFENKLQLEDYKNLKFGANTHTA